MMEGEKIIETMRIGRVLIQKQVMGIKAIPHYQGIDYSKFSPLLVAAIQELSAKVDALEAEIDALNAIHN